MTFPQPKRWERWLGARMRWWGTATAFERYMTYGVDGYDTDEDECSSEEC